MNKDIVKFINNCDKCPFDTVVADTIGPLPKREIDGHCHCNLLKYLIIVPVKNKSVKTIAQAIVENCILKFGPMKNY